ncbi:hypothetical protein SNE40_020422 [Patella caerulea]|uniref:Protein XRP2 n=2 Tax=Patella caerulea TaxID=87958 RepID=A0AAN8G7H7_PATCE
MGCILSHLGVSANQDESFEIQPKKYSWDKRDKMNVQDFIIDGVKNETVGRLPGVVNGQQMVIQNCENCNIYIFDHTNTLTIDDCTDCNIFLGPVKTSVFIRDCKNCNFAVACQQFRTRDCSQVSVYLSCGTQPIIESSTGMKFGCLQYNYPELKDQFKAAGLSIYNNNWSNIHDFTPVPGENNFGLMAEDVIVDCSLIPTTEQFSTVEVTSDKNTSLVPYTSGSRRKTSDESCLVVFFKDDATDTRAEMFTESLIRNGSFILAQTKEVPMQAADAQRVFGSDVYSKAVGKGEVIGLEINGTGCIKFCQDVIADLLKDSPGVVFVSQNQAAATQNIDNFYNFANMQMEI